MYVIDFLIFRCFIAAHRFIPAAFFLILIHFCSIIKYLLLVVVVLLVPLFFMIILRRSVFLKYLAIKKCEKTFLKKHFKKR